MTMGEAARLEPRPRTVLIAEDNADFRALLGAELREAGYHVVELRDGTQLLDYVAAHLGPDGAVSNVDVIVSDVRMPGYSGMDVLVGLRRALGATPVIIITAFGDDETHDLAKAMGAFAVLDKPFDVDELKRAVSAALAG